MLTIYRRLKLEQGWRFIAVQTGRGIKTGELHGPFFVRKPDKRWHNLGADNYTDAVKAAEDFAAGKVAVVKHGLTVKEYEDATNRDRMTLTAAVEKFFNDRDTELKKRSVTAYRNDLNEFVDNVGVRFLDELTADTMRTYYHVIRKKHRSKRTVRNHVINVHTLLKSLKIPDTVRVDMKKVGKIERAVVVPYTDEQVKALLDAMPADLRVTFRFFLGSGCREQEVQFATWNDVDLTANTFTVSAKPDVSFTPKNHKERIVVLPLGVVKDLKEWRKTSTGRWLFPSKHNKPDGHFLRKLKKVAFRAGLNCGHCINRAGVSCKDADVCSQFKLHKFRKTCATRWASSDVPLNDIREYLGHESLNTTQIYLGTTPPHKARPNIDRAFGD